MTVHLLTLNSSKTEFLLIGNRQQLSKIHNTSLDTNHSARNLGFSFDEHLTLSDQISALSKSCYSHIRQLRCIRPYLDHETASTIATFIVHSEFYYAVVTCELKLFQNYFSLYRRPSGIILPEIISKLFKRLIAAYENFPTCSVSLK